MPLRFAMSTLVTRSQQCADMVNDTSIDGNEWKSIVGEAYYPVYEAAAEPGLPLVVPSHVRPLKVTPVLAHGPPASSRTSTPSPPTPPGSATLTRAPAPLTSLCTSVMDHAPPPVRAAYARTSGLLEVTAALYSSAPRVA